jgi:hypothetical protein
LWLPFGLCLRLIHCLFCYLALKHIRGLF